MNSDTYTMRDLEAARVSSRTQRRPHPEADILRYLITFALVAACWLARELFLSM